MSDEPEKIEPSFDSTQDDSTESEVEEFEYNDDGEEDLKKTLKKLRADLKVVQKEKQDYLTGWQKERADFLNYKKEEDDRRAKFSEVLREDILSRFLSLADSFNMAFANREAWEKVDPSWRKGVEYIYAQLEGIFEEYGIEEVGKVGESFDPSMHHSIHSTQTDKKDEDHKIAEVIQKGYKLAGRILRPARVNVYEYKNGTE